MFAYYQVRIKVENYNIFTFDKIKSLTLEDANTQ